MCVTVRDHHSSEFCHQTEKVTDIHLRRQIPTDICQAGL